ncbi:MAG: hypothetical protein AAGC54_01960, partial [Cyanobacteria bacterium P01_F01_bin.4]
LDQLRVNADHPHAIAQYENLLIWYGTAAPEISLPAACAEQVNNITFLACDQTWIAIHHFDRGFALEMGESQTDGSLDRFKQRVTTQARLIVDPERVEYRDSQGKTVAIAPRGTGLPQIWRDGTRHDWRQHDRSLAFEIQ